MDTIDTSRLIIRPFVMDDLEQLHQILDQELNWSGQGFTIAQRKRKLQSYIDLADWGDAGSLYGYRAVTLRESNHLIGMCAFIPHMFSVAWKEIFWEALFPHALPSERLRASLELEIGYAVSIGYQGQGYATEAAQVFIHYAFEELKINRVFASTNRKNIRSIALMQRVGMRTASNQKNPEDDWPGVVGVIESG